MSGGPFPFKLDSCVWEITLECCFSCRYCGSRAGKKRNDELSTLECLGVVSQLSDLKCRRVSLIGGEVFMRKDWDVITKALTDRGINVCIITNGFWMTDETVSKIKKTNVESVAVSLDGPEDVHDASRQAGSYKRAVGAIERLCKEKIPVSVISSLRSDNAGRLDGLYETLKKYPIFAWQLQACSPMGFANDNSVDVRFDVKKVIEFISRVKGDAPFSVGAADNIGYYTKEEGTLRGNDGSYFSGCSAGLTTVGIDSVGNVRGCESMYDSRFIEGNLRERTLREIWEDENAFSYNRRFTKDLLTGKCEGCEYGEYCAGGCRSYNYFSGGKLYENPLCAHAKALRKCAEESVGEEI